MPYRHLGLALFTIVTGCEYEVAPRYDDTTDFTMIGSTSAVVHFDVKADRPQRTMSTSAPIRTLYKRPATDVSTPRREACNGLDDDGDESVDEDFPRTCAICDDDVRRMCTELFSRCTNLSDTQLQQCSKCGLIPYDDCDNSDDDCDGEIDEDGGDGCQTCSPLQSETCDGFDNDCDGAVDEGVLNRCGQCGPPPDEGCANVDNDCDSDCRCLPGDTRLCETNDGLCAGEQRCESGRWSECKLDVMEISETCNGRDDDCDGEIDEGNACPCPGFKADAKHYLLCGANLLSSTSLMDLPAQWDVALQICRRLGYELVSIHSQLQNDVIAFHLALFGVDEAWLGYRFDQTNRQFEWSDGSEPGYQRWSMGEPSIRFYRRDACAAILIDEGAESSWEAEDCRRNHTFLCEAHQAGL